MRRLLLRLVLVVFLPAPAPAHADTVPKVVVVGIPGLRWSDVTERATPTLYRLQQTAASGVLSVKTAAALDCPADGWLTLGAGNRVVAQGGHVDPCPQALPGQYSLPLQRRANADRREGAMPGLLADLLRRKGICVSATGIGAGMAAADGSGNVGRDCPVQVVEATIATSDVAITRAVATGATVLVVGVSEGAGESDPHLHVVLATGPGFEPGALTSASTRRAPYVQLVDVAPTVLQRFGIAAPDEMIGEPIRSVGDVPTLAALRDEAVKADAHRTATVPWFVTVLGLEALVLSLGMWRRRWRIAELAGLAGTCAVGASYLANLLPWWRSGTPALLGLTAVGTAVLTGITLLGRGLLARAGIACGLVALVVVADLLTGAHLQLSSVAGYSPLVAGRFAGIGNVAFGVLAAAVLLAAASTRSATVAALTALVVIVDGAPQWGSDVGGVLALVPAYAVLVLLLAGRAASLGRVAVAAVVGALVVTAFAVADHARPAADQTHLGRFVGQVLDGSAGGVLRRKAVANLSLLFHSPITALLPVVVAGAVYLFLRPPEPLRRVFDRTPAWRAGLLAVLTASALGFLLNDSGAAVPALALVVAVPATLAVVARQERTSG
jgi:hypothetical protein